MTLVTVTAHPLLTGKVNALGTDPFAAQQKLAEALLGLTQSFVDRCDADQLDRVTMAVALQMNFQVEQGLDPFVVQSESSTQQGESRTYRDDAVNPQSQAIIAGIQLTGTDGGKMVRDFANIRPVRSLRTDARSW